MKLKELLAGISYEVLGKNKINDELEIDCVEYDTRRLSGHSVYVPLIMGKIDGHDYIAQAIEKKAELIFVSKDTVELSEDSVFLKVLDTNKTLSQLAMNFYHHPTNALKLIGVTGTNGKTTTTFLIERCLKYFKKNTGLIGTVETHIKEESFPSSNTTPFATDLQRILSKMVEAGVEYVPIEVSSHALTLERVCGCEFEIGVFTNLTQDHMDFHKTFEEYRDAKLKLLLSSKNAIVNSDTEVSSYYIEELKKKTHIDIFTYGIHHEADVLAKNISIDITGSKFDVVYKEEVERFEVVTPGEFSVYNTLSTISTLIVLGYTLGEIREALSSQKGVSGRFETFVSKNGFCVVVDYAHTPDGLLNVLKTANEFAKGRVITVFGCGGDRDRSKRPKMGRIAGEYSNIVVLTSDNPRTEDPELIMDEIEVGLKETNVEYIRIENRYEAIKYAMQHAKKDDVVMVAGKGHEDYQILNTGKIHFSDIENVKKLIE